MHDSRLLHSADATESQRDNASSSARLDDDSRQDRRATMSARPGWLDGRIDALLAALGEFGMAMSRASAGVLITERVDSVAAQLGITPAAARRHLSDDALARLARTMVLPFADETPDADVTKAPRTAALPITALGRCVAGLAEAMQVRLRESDDVEHIRAMTRQLAQTLSALGQVTADPDAGAARTTTAAAAGGPAGDVAMPPGLLHRAARYLDATAVLVADGVLPDGFDPSHADGLAETFRSDAARLRYYATG